MYAKMLGYDYRVGPGSSGPGINTVVWRAEAVPNPITVTILSAWDPRLGCTGKNITLSAGVEWNLATAIINLSQDYPGPFTLE